MLLVRVLGPVRVGTDDNLHSLGSPTQRALFARLVFAGGRTVSPEHLIDDLWEDSPPRDPMHALQARVSRLRAAVPVAIELREGGYWLDSTGVQTDAAEFEQLCDRSAHFVQRGDIAQAAECLHHALRLWHGEAFAGLAQVPTLRAEAARLEELRAAATADRLDLDLALGRSGIVIPELHALVQRYPLSERHWAQLMTALYLEGRAPEALAAFADARSTFADGLGMDPSGDLVDVHLAILREQPPESLVRVAAPALPSGAADGGEAIADTMASRTVTSHQSDVVTSVLPDLRAILLTGPAGIGKTHLLRAVSSRLVERGHVAPVLTASALSRPVPLGIFSGTGEWPAGEGVSPAALIDDFTRHRSTTVLLVDRVDQLDDASLFVVTHLIRTTRLPAILTVRDLGDAPEEIRSVYDSGDVTEIRVGAFTSTEVMEFAAAVVDGPLAPDACVRLHAASGGNPLYLREILTASVDEGRLVRHAEAWELDGDPASTPRLRHLVGQRFNGLDDVGMEAAAKVAIAGELPAAALGAAPARALARAGVVEYSAPGWLRLSHPLDADVVRSQCSAVLWHDLTAEVVKVLLSDLTAQMPAARRRARILALELDDPIDVTATLAVARHALGTSHDRLALRAAQAITTQDAHHGEAHRIAGLAASALGMADAAQAHLDRALAEASTDAHLAAVALARARHLGVHHHDAAAALAVLEQALESVTDHDQAGHLRRDIARWAAIAGQASMQVGAPVENTDAAAALGLVTIAMAGVITGPLDDTARMLARLHRMPAEVIEMVPGGAHLMKLAEVMALSNTGDVIATGRRLDGMIADAHRLGDTSLGVWEYARGFSELLAGDAEHAHRLAADAVGHLEWRDPTGLAPAARALAGASAYVIGHADAGGAHFAAVPDSAINDPKVVMLRGWADAWREHTGERTAAASRILLETAGWLMQAHHHYFAGMLAHCAARVGEDREGAMTLLKAARLAAGGGLLELCARHAAAMVADDRGALTHIAAESHELGMSSTAVDTWLYLASRWPGADDADHPHRMVKHLRTGAPSMVLWTPVAS